MPQASNQDIIVVLPEIRRIIRGQAQSFNFIIYKNNIGNQLNINNAVEVIAEISDQSLNVVKTFKKSDGTLTYGQPNSDVQGEVVVSLTAEESSSLVLSDNNIQGELYVRFIVQQNINQVVVPKVKTANIFDAGQNVGDGIVASRFTLPAPVYSIKSFNIADSVSHGEMVINSADPMSITKVKFSVTDDKGYRNGFIEGVLEDRFNTDGTSASIYLTNVYNNSEYTLLKVVSWGRIDQNTADAAKNNSRSSKAKTMWIYFPKILRRFCCTKLSTKTLLIVGVLHI